MFFIMEPFEVRETILKVHFLDSVPLSINSFVKGDQDNYAKISNNHGDTLDRQGSATMQKNL